jgi:N-acetylglucosamine-6-phosphate deacetylase
MSHIVLKNALLIFRDRESQFGSVVITDGRIAEISTSAITRGDVIVDLDGAKLFPGFIDVHIHGAAGYDVMDASPADLATISQYLATQGVTGWLPTMVPAANSDYEKTVKNIARATAQTEGARMLGVHYEGPFVNDAQCGALHREHFKTYSNATDLNRFSLPDVDSFARMMTLAPEVEGGVALIKELTERGWITSIGHTRADISVLDQAHAAGARHMTHFMNAMAPLHHRNPGPIAWGLTHDDVTCDFIADGIHLDVYMLRLLLKLKGAGSLSLISDAIAAAGEGDGDYQIWGETISVRNGRTSNAAGSIAGSVITMLDAVRMMRSLGATDVEIAQMASLNPARLLGIDHECGSIEEGKRADLVALDERGDVKLTIVSGEIAYSRLATELNQS